MCVFCLCLLFRFEYTYYNFIHLQIRPLWRFYFQNTEGIIFAVDSNDRDRVVEARDELHKMLNEVCHSNFSSITCLGLSLTLATHSLHPGHRVYIVIMMLEIIIVIFMYTDKSPRTMT